jgi:hypothetical protein
MQGATARGAQYAPTPPVGDFYKIARLLSDSDCALIEGARAAHQWSSEIRERSSVKRR